MLTVLLLGGTGEARALAAELAGDTGIRLISSLAGRVARPALPVGEVRVGGFGGVGGLAGWLREHSPAIVLDATHPFAATISGNAAAACRSAGIELLRVHRPGWIAGEDDKWTRVPDQASAAQALPTLGSRPFLTTGRGGLELFALRPVTALVRCVDPPGFELPGGWRLLLDRGPYVLSAEIELMRSHRADVLVSKDSGGSLTQAKLHAARELAVPVLMIDRPAAVDTPVVQSVAAAAAWVRARAVAV